MSKTRGFLLAAAVAAMTFTFSCSLDDISDYVNDSSSSSVGGQGGGGGSSSSSSVVTQGNVVYGSPVSYGGETYQTVVIGTQTWFARNLNYDPNTGNSVCYGNDQENCEKYGRLYDWSTAMDIDVSYNSSSWNGSDIKHQGICPIGWHLPSSDEWGVLRSYVDYNSGTKLKATSGWNDYNGASGNGTDNYGFSALPGGYGYSNGRFLEGGIAGTWRIATERNSGNTYIYFMSYNNYGGRNEMNTYSYSKSDLFSVRCVQD
jgi:uncharacterized protein (TIGR02145 family)